MSAKKNRDENANATQPKKRPRGRPRKNPIPESIKVVEESVEKKQNLPQIEKLREAGVPNLTILKKELPSTENEINSWREELSNEINRLEGELKIVDKEYRESGVRVIGLSPGTVSTDMQVQIKASGINPVSQLDPGAHIPPEWVARAIVWLVGAEADPYRGGDFSLKTKQGREAVGLDLAG